MVIKRCLAVAIGFAISLYYHLLFLLPVSNFLDTTFHFAEVETTSIFRNTPYHRHIKFRNYQDDNRTSSSSSSSSSNGIRISFELHDPQTVPLENAFNPYVKCPLGPLSTGKKNQQQIPTGYIRSGELPPSLIRVDDERDMYGQVRSGRVLNFTVTISTDLKLLFIGDSIMVQYGM